MDLFISLVQIKGRNLKIEEHSISDKTNVLSFAFLALTVKPPAVSSPQLVIYQPKLFPTTANNDTLLFLCFPDFRAV